MISIPLPQETDCACAGGGTCTDRRLVGKSHKVLFKPHQGQIRETMDKTHYTEAAAATVLGDSKCTLGVVDKAFRLIEMHSTKQLGTADGV